ncbi:MAG: TldD/PmbA family protein [Pseudomonadota bacterium]
MKTNLKQALNSLNSKADWVGLRYVEEDSRSFHIRDERVENVSQDMTAGVMVEVLVNGQFHYAATADTSNDGIARAHNRAMALAEFSKGWSLAKFDEDQRPKAVGAYSSAVDQDLDQLGIEELVSTLVDSSKAMKSSDEVVSRVAYAQNSKTNMSFVSSNGSEFEQSFSQNFSHLSVTAQRGGDVQTRTNGMDVSQSGFEFFNREKAVASSQKIGEQVLELLDAENCPEGTMDLLLAPSQLYLQIHESIGHPLELDRILGDERNYAGWSFVGLEDFGKLQYGSELLNVTFDPTISSELASYMYDDTGAKASKEYIIKDGKLLRGLGSLESQSRSQVPGVACARSTSWNRPPLDRMANLNIEPGSSSMDEMISSVERGILMDTNKSWSIDDYRNKFQFGCEFGRLIENGQITKTVKNPNYRGVCTPFWNSLKMVGNGDNFEVWGSFFCGKAEPNQVIRVGHATPHCLFSNIEVFGGAS